MQNEDIEVTTEKKSWRDLFEGYADEYVREGVAFIKRLRLAITVVAVGWVAFLILLAILLVMTLAR